MATNTIRLEQGATFTLTSDARINVFTGSIFISDLNVAFGPGDGIRDIDDGTVLQAQTTATFSVTDIDSANTTGGDTTALTQRVLNLETNEAAQNTAIAAETTAREAAINGIDPLTSETTGQTLAQIRTILADSNRLANNNVGLFALLNDILSRITTLENN